MFCRFFILRPVLSIVISLVIVLAGAVAIWASPIAQYPDITPPSIKITAYFAGANSETLASTVAAPLEDQISGVSHMIYMVSSSSNGSNSVTITVYFDIGTSLDAVISDVLNRVNTAASQLPTAVQQQGIVVRKSSPDLFLLINMHNDHGYPNDLFLSNYTYRYVYPALSQVNGIGLVNIIGSRNFSMRVWLDPKKLAYYNLSVNDVIAAIKEQNNPFVIGMTGMPPTDGNAKFQFMINTQGYLTDVKQFENIIVKASQNGSNKQVTTQLGINNNQQNTSIPNSNQVVRVKDLGRVSLDGQQYNTTAITVNKMANGKLNFTHTIPMILFLSPGANQLATKDRVIRVMDNLAKHFPLGIHYYIHFDSTVFVKASIKQVLDTLRDALLLVMLVVFLFIQNIRGTIIPILAIPVSIIGTFAGTYAFGFSINTLTLFGIVLAIGIVVDDAIVVLENTERLMEEKGLNSVHAAIEAMAEVASPVIAIVLVLNAVFIPVAFLGGFTGLLYKQFAITIAISVFISGIVALTLTPTLCALFLKNNYQKSGKDNTTANSATTDWQNTASLTNTSTARTKSMVIAISAVFSKYMSNFFAAFNHAFFAIRNFYLVIVRFLIVHVKTAYGIFAAVIVITLGLYLYIPVSLIPLEDMGYYYINATLPGAASLDRTTTAAQDISRYIETFPQTQKLISVVGVDLLDNFTNKTNALFMVPILTPWDQRKAKNEQVDAIINKINHYGYVNKDVRMLALNQPPIRGLSSSGGVTFYLQALTDVTSQKLYADSMAFIAGLHKYKAVGFAMQFYDVSVPQLYVDLDRTKAKLYGVDIGSVYNALQATFGTYYVNYFERWNDVWWVILQSDYKDRKTPELLKTVYVKNNQDQMIPIGSLAKIYFKTGPEVVTRFDDYPASQLIVNPTPGYTSGDVMNAINDLAKKTLGTSYIVKWYGPAYQQALAGSNSLIAFTLGLLMVFLILAALYEMWSLPLAVIAAIPFALLGAAFLLLVTGRPNDIYFQVSLITLLGLSAKNAILIVEFALESYKKGTNAVDAALEAARLRFRPIVMTSLAFILGTLPLALADGAGANSQHSVGTGILGGMIGSTMLATLFVPLFFVSFIRFSKVKQHDRHANHQTTHQE